ncbi:MAG: SCO family protein [Pseudomonadota bacterium]
MPGSRTWSGGGRLLGAALAGLVVPVAGLAALAEGPPQEVAAIEPAPLGGRFILAAHDGRTVTDEDFRGRHLLVFFGYTHCPDVCPTSLQTVAHVLELLGPAADRVQPVFITVDPARDTSKVLAAFVNHFDARIIGLTGSEPMIDRVAKGFRVKYQKSEPSKDGFYSVDHTAALFHVGPAGQSIGRFNYEVPAEEIAAALRAAIAVE